jgi:hypothetical protein
VVRDKRLVFKRRYFSFLDLQLNANTKRGYKGLNFYNPFFVPIFAAMTKEQVQDLRERVTSLRRHL